MLPKAEDILANIELMYSKLAGGLIVRIPEKGAKRQLVIDALREYGRQVRNETLNWAAENAEIECLDWDTNYIDKQSILNGKTDKDLEI